MISQLNSGLKEGFWNLRVIFRKMAKSYTRNTTNRMIPTTRYATTWPKPQEYVAPPSVRPRRKRTRPTQQNTSPIMSKPNAAFLKPDGQDAGLNSGFCNLRQVF